MIDTFLWLVFIAVSIYLLVWLLAYVYLADRLMFYPPAYNSDYDAQYDFVALKHANGESIQGLWIGEDASADWVLLYQHGNAELLAEIVPRLQALHDITNVAIFAYEYRGYGGSDGRHSIKHMREDGELAWHYLMAQGYRAEQVIVYGRSLGSSNATHLSQQHDPVGALILEVPMWDAFRVYAPHFWTWRSHLENGRRINHITAPTFILYGEYDELIKPWHSHKLCRASAARVKECIGFQEGHSGVPTSPNYAKVITDIIEQLPNN